MEGGTDNRVLYDGDPTVGVEPEFDYPILKSRRPQWTGKVCDLETGRFATLVPWLSAGDRWMSFGQSE